MQFGVAAVSVEPKLPESHPPAKEVRLIGPLILSAPLVVIPAPAPPETVRRPVLERDMV